MKKQHPKSEDILKVINNFERVVPIAMTSKESFDMSEGDVKRVDSCANSACNTTMCHGGWYAAAIWDEEFPNRKKGINYEHGANIMAKHLGFKKERHQDGGTIDPVHALEEWAQENPEIWGNTDGGCMFSHEDAFKSGRRGLGAQNLKHVVDHWKEVYKRVKKLEK